MSGPYGGIDLGGTKIEAALYDADLNQLAVKRIATPKTYEALLDAVAAQYAWICETAGKAHVMTGMAQPGLVDRSTGQSLTANIPAMGKPFHADVSKRLGFDIPFENDCRCFALSEANGGAAAGYDVVFGLIMGTGCGGGVCHNGKLVEGLNHISGEVGHFGIPAHLIEKHKLPVLKCGCGRVGCYETLISGPGLSRIAASVTGIAVPSEECAERARQGDQQMEKVFDIWAELTCELLMTIQMCVDPQCIVIGGGLSRIDGLHARLAKQYPQHKLPGVVQFEIVAPKYGDSSGVRASAMLAKARAEQEQTA